MDMGKRVWEGYFRSEMCSRYWRMQAERFRRFLLWLNLSIVFVSIMAMAALQWGAPPWVLPLCGFMVAGLGFVVSHGKVAESATRAGVAQSLWLTASERYKDLFDRSRGAGREVAESELDAMKPMEEAIAVLTSNTFDRKLRLVNKAEEECYKFFGTRPTES